MSATPKPHASLLLEEKVSAKLTDEVSIPIIAKQYHNPPKADFIPKGFHHAVISSASADIIKN